MEQPLEPDRKASGAQRESNSNVFISIPFSIHRRDKASEPRFRTQDQIVRAVECSAPLASSTGMTRYRSAPECSAGLRRRPPSSPPERRQRARRCVRARTGSYSGGGDTGVAGEWGAIAKLCFFSAFCYQRSRARGPRATTSASCQYARSFAKGPRLRLLRAATSPDRRRCGGKNGAAPATGTPTVQAWRPLRGRRRSTSCSPPFSDRHPRKTWRPSMPRS